MLNGLFDKLPADATPLFHSDQGWQYQHAEYQRLLAEHDITQSMSRKGNCMDNGAMENFFGRLKVGIRGIPQKNVYAVCKRSHSESEAYCGGYIRIYKGVCNVHI